MDNKFLSLVSSPLMNLDHTYRYSGTKLVESETLSQHIVDTIMLGIKMIDEINYISYENLDPEKYVMKAVYHDLEEAITGDVPRPLKYYNDATLASMRDVANCVAEDLFKDQFHTAMDHYDKWYTAKNGKEGYILKLVDNLVVVNKVVKEVSLLHNYYMLKVAHEVVSYTTELRDHLTKDTIFSAATTEYLSDLMGDAIKALNDILGYNENPVLKDLNIAGQSMI